MGSKKDKNKSCCSSIMNNMCGCKIQSVVSIDERGQMIIPKDVREKANIRNGDKLAIVSWEQEGKIRCISLVRAEDIAEMVNELLGPMAKEIIKTGGKNT